MCLGCLFLSIAAFAPRIAVALMWLFTNIEQTAFRTWPLSPWVWTLAGLIFLPWTTLLFCLVSVTEASGNIFGWLIIAMGLVMDLGHYFESYQERDKAKSAYSRYTTGAPV
jgi:hypothetical protein